MCVTVSDGSISTSKVCCCWFFIVICILNQQENPVQRNRRSCNANENPMQTNMQRLSKIARFNRIDYKLANTNTVELKKNNFAIENELAQNVVAKKIIFRWQMIAAFARVASTIFSHQEIFSQRCDFWSECTHISDKNTCDEFANFRIRKTKTDYLSFYGCYLMHIQSNALNPKLSLIEYY